MKKYSLLLLLLVLLMALVVLPAGNSLLFGRGGGGGGFHGGGGFGGGFHGGGGYGGFHGGDFGGGYHGDFGGAGHYGGYGGDRFDAGGYRGGYDNLGRVGGYGNFDRAAGYGAVRPETLHPATSNLGYGDHRNLPGDWGMGRAAVRPDAYLNRGNFTRPVTNNWANYRGNDVRRNFNQYNYFNRGWYGNHPGAWYAAGWRHGAYWGWASWPMLGGWFGWGAGVAPIYYDYGNTIVYQGDEVYSGGQPIASADDYYQQASDLAQTGQAGGDGQPADNQQAAPAQGSDWQSLGVFSLVQGEQSDTSALFQLAVNKAGQIAGNYNDVLTGGTLPVHGAVDQKTQRAAWTVGDNKTTVYETGIYNLTKDQTPVLVHFGKDRTQQWLLVRMKQPESAQEDAPADGQ